MHTADTAFHLQRTLALNHIVSTAGPYAPFRDARFPPSLDDARVWRRGRYLFISAISSSRRAPCMPPPDMRRVPVGAFATLVSARRMGLNAARRADILGLECEE